MITPAKKDEITRKYRQDPVGWARAMENAKKEALEQPLDRESDVFLKGFYSKDKKTSNGGSNHAG